MLNAQDITVQFEDSEWDTQSCGSGQPNYLELKPTTFWANLNSLCKLGQPIITVTQTTDAVSGKAALLRTQILGIANADSTPGFGSRLIPGLINSGALNTSNLNNPLIQGQPYTGRPSCMRGYYKFFPIQGDSAAIYVELRKNGAIVGKAALSVTAPTATYTQFDLPITYFNTNTPDSINIVFASSSGALSNKGRKGTRLYLDEVEILMDCTSGIGKASYEPLAKLYPNPATSQLNVKLFEGISELHLSLYNLEGKKILERVVLETNTEISLDGLPAGFYTYLLQAPNAAQQSGKLMVR